VALLIVQLDGVEVDVCHECRGAWLDAGESAQLGAQPATQSQVVAETTPYLCPRCDQPLRQIRRNSVKLEECTGGHGLWLDAGELAQLQAPVLKRMFTKPNQGD